MHFPCSLPDNLRIMFKWRMRRQHVVISGDDADIRPSRAEKMGFLNDGTSRRGMSQVSLAQTLPCKPFRTPRADHIQIFSARLCRTLADAFGHLGDLRMQTSHLGSPYNCETRTEFINRIAHRHIQRVRNQCALQHVQLLITEQ